MRKIRVLIISNNSELSRDVQHFLESVHYHVFHHHRLSGMELVQEVYIPDVLISLDLLPDEQEKIVRYFNRSLQYPLLMILKRWQYFSRCDCFVPPDTTSEVLIAPVTPEQLIASIERLSVNIRADIALLSDAGEGNG